MQAGGVMNPRRKQREKKMQVGRWAAAIVALTIGFIGVCATAGVAAVVGSWTQDLPELKQEDLFNYADKTRIYANDGKTLLAEFYLQNQEPVEADQVSELVLKGTVATEDERFYDHNGIDLAGIARALVNNLMGGDLEGASTITQQLVRNTVLSSEANDISLRRKVREAELALDLEKQYSKDDILVMYINTINYGDGCYGIQAASQHYFQKDAADLTINEAATLIGIPQSPTYNNPVDYPENCLARRNVVLDRMLSNGVITQEEYDTTKAEPLQLNIQEDKADDGIYKYPFFTSEVRRQLIESLSYESVFEGGLTVHTTIDPKMQKYAESAAKKVYKSMENSGDDDVKLAMTCIDPNTGYVLAMIGGRDYRENEFNLATSEAGRQAGSAFKVFTLAAAIEQGINPNTLIDCSAHYTYKGSTEWDVSNINNIDYGVRSIASATWVSSNTGYARLVTDPDAITPADVLDLAERLGVTGKVEEGYSSVPSITLGVSQTNTTEMAGAYGVFANEGVKMPTTFITKVEDKDGEVLVDNTKPEGEEVISPEVAYATTQVLEGVLTKSGGTAVGYSLSSGQVAAGKTGTSEEVRDLWFCGYTPQLSCAVWTGADPERSMYQASWAKDMWKYFMDKALESYDIEDFATADKPEYKHPFNKKQQGLDTEAAKKLIKSLDGKSLADVKKALADEEMKTVEKYSNSVPEGEVISITFKDGVYTVTVSKGPDPAKEEEEQQQQQQDTISASVVGTQEADAIQALTSAGFASPSVTYKASNQPAGTVISQSKTSGKRGDSVSIVVSSGPAQTPTTPTG